MDTEGKRQDTIQKTRELDVMLYYLEKQDNGDPDAPKDPKVDALIPWEKVCEEDLKPL